MSGNVRKTSSARNVTHFIKKIDIFFSFFSRIFKTKRPHVVETIFFYAPLVHFQTFIDLDNENEEEKTNSIFVDSFSIVGFCAPYLTGLCARRIRSID